MTEDKIELTDRQKLRERCLERAQEIPDAFERVATADFYARYILSGEYEIRTTDVAELSQ